MRDLKRCCVLLSLLTALTVLHLSSAEDSSVSLFSEITNSPVPNITILSASQIQGNINQGLECRSNDTITQDIGRWFDPNGVEILFDFQTFYRLREPGVVTLYRSTGLEGREGIYMCQMPDTTGTVFTLYAGLYTDSNYGNGRPVFPSLPNFVLLSSLSTFPPSFTVTCTSSMFPPTYVNWTRDGLPIENGVSYQTSQILIDAVTSTFENILTVRDNLPGLYECIVSNSQSMSSANITVRAPSVSPRNISSEFLGGGNVRITWTPPAGQVDGYQIFYEQVNGSDSGMINITGTSNSAMLRALRPAATYSVEILAYSDLPTELSDAISITLNVASSPENITVDSVISDATSLYVNWDPPTTGSSNVVGYMIEYEPASDPMNCPGISGGQLGPITNTGAFITGLEENTKYSIRVRTISTAAVGQPSSPINATTSISAPSGPPLNVQITTINPSMINVTWEPPECLLQNGPITSYVVTRTDLRFSVNETFMIDDPEQLDRLVSGLASFRNYSFIVAAVNVNGSYPSSRVYGHLINVPGPVENLGDLRLDVTTVELEWDPPRDNSILLEEFYYRDFNYSIRWSLAPSAEGQSSGPPLGSAVIQSVRRFTIGQLTPNTTYRVSVFAISSFGAETNGRSVDEITRPINQIGRPRISEVNGTSLNVTWNPLTSSDILYYRVYYNSTSNPELQMVNISGHDSSLISLHELDHSATYTFRIAAVVNTTLDGLFEGPLSNETFFSFTQTSNLRLILIITGGTVGGIALLVVVIIITIVILALLNRSIGPQYATKGEEGYMLIPLKRRELSQATPTTGRPTIADSPPTEIHAVEGQEVVLRIHFYGDPTPTLSWKQNGKEIVWENATFLLRDGAIIFPYVEVDHSGEYEVTAENSHGNESATITLNVYPETDLVQVPQKGDAITSVNIPLREFGQYVASLHANSNKKFREQFRRLNAPELPVELALKDENHPYNRNQNVVVFDANHIELEPLPRFLDCQHTYINASYIVGEGENPRQFIATQGPLDRTVVDFWRMVWQEKVCAVVMLTGLQEDLRIKCSQYWPSKGSENHGPFTVTLIKETVHPGYVIRELTVHYNTMIGNLRSKLVNPMGKVDTNKKEYFSASQSTLVVTQYHYLDWPEHGSPHSVSSLLSLHRSMLSGTEQKKGPIVVHCSAGAGRTGAFITMDMALKQAQTQSSVDIPALVADIRQQRMMMIQTLEQYMTVHDAVLEQVLCGNTQVLARELRNVIHSLSSKDKDDSTGFEAQFNVLEQISVTPEDAICEMARHNMRKNRHKDILPNDQWRVPLKGEAHDYINASFIPGYKNSKAFVIAQSPLRETRRDFWKMIFDRDITTLIMLSPIMEGGEEVCAQYWPSEGNVEFGEFLVTVKEQWSHEGFSRKLLLVRDSKNNLLRKLVQFQVAGWSSDGVSACSIISIVNTINLVTIVQRKNPQIPLLVHCSNSIGRSAMFCATMATIDQIKSEGVADVFQAVKAMRTQLPGAVQTREQYEMIHLLTASYIDLFSTSANF